VHAVDTRLAWKGLGLGVTGAQPLFNAIVTLTLSLGCRSLWIKQSSYQDEGAAAAGKSSPYIISPTVPIVVNHAQRNVAKKASAHKTPAIKCASTPIETVPNVAYVSAIPGSAHFAWNLSTPPASSMAEPKFIPGIALLAIFLSGCGSTITTRIQSEPASPVPAAVLSHAQINRDVREMEPGTGMRINPRKSDASLRELVRSSGTDPERLAQAAEFALERAINSPKSQRQQRAGFAFAACEIAYQSLRDSGVSASGWLTNSATRRACPELRPANPRGLVTQTVKVQRGFYRRERNAIANKWGP